MPDQPPARRRDALLALALAGVAALFRLPRLGFPNEEVFDEVYHARTALQYLRGEPPTEWVHPPTAKLLIAVGVWRFGYHAWAWRLLPALAGVALAPVFFLLARRVLATERAALLASVLLLADGVYLVQSRTAMTNIFAVLFQVAAALFVLQAALPDRLHAGWMTAAGVCLGLALSTRWTSLWAAAFLGLVLLAVRGIRHLGLRELRFTLLAFPAVPTGVYLLSQAAAWMGLGYYLGLWVTCVAAFLGALLLLVLGYRVLGARGLALTLLAFALLPLWVYVLSYVPWMRQGHKLSELWPLQQAIWRYHAGLRATHPYFSNWYTWPWLYRPTWYYFKQDNCFVRGIVAIGNPALWWMSVPASAWALATGIRARDPRRLFAGAGFFALYLPWGVSPRTLNYSHYLFEAIPYACLTLGLVLDRLWDGPARTAARGYVVLVILVFLFFLPFLVALPVPLDWYYYDFHNGARPWTWFPTWV
jgi:dolichyl-phosphate-mannose--protein O-mannosyl transferase